MALPKETCYLGADPHCWVCGKLVKPQKLRTPAGWYIGTQCCEPHSRETKYYPSEQILDQMIEAGTLQYRTPEGFTSPIPLQPILEP